MNTVDQIYNKTSNAADFSKSYLAYLSEIFQLMDYQSIEKMAQVILKARETENTVFFIGNGGSAATASHFANDLAIGTRCRNKKFKALSLTDNVAAMTAIANDWSYEDLFAKQLEAYYKSGDVLVSISASGNSPNVIKATEYVKNQGGFTIGLTGFDGGRLKEIVDLAVHVPSNKGEYGPVEDVHMILDHIIHSYVKRYVDEHDKG